MGLREETKQVEAVPASLKVMVGLGCLEVGLGVFGPWQLFCSEQVEDSCEKGMSRNGPESPKW